MFSARSELINDLHREGVKEGMWPVLWTPEGIKGPFKSYLKDKAKNIYKRKQSDDEQRDLMEALKAIENGDI